MVGCEHLTDGLSLRARLAEFRWQQVWDRVHDGVALAAGFAGERARNDVVALLALYNQLQLTVVVGASENRHKVDKQESFSVCAGFNRLVDVRQAYAGYPTGGR